MNEPNNKPDGAAKTAKTEPCNVAMVMLKTESVGGHMLATGKKFHATRTKADELIKAGVAKETY